MSDKTLDELFAAARSSAPEPSAQLLARISADAQAVQLDHTAPQTVPEPRRASGREAGGQAKGLWGQIIGALGGWTALAGLATATVAGVWIGISPPQGLADPLSAAIGTSQMTGFDEIGAGFDFTQFEG